MPPPASVPVSVLMPVKNEQRHMEACLASVVWANEIVVVDSASSDATIEIAERHGARVVQFAYQPGGPRKKNWALQNLQFRNEWILILDADERITPALALDIDRAIGNSDGHAGFYLNRRFNFLGSWIYHAGYFPSWNLRLFRHGLGLFETLSHNSQHSGDNEVHEHLILNGSAGYLASPMDHYAYPTLGEFIEKHRRYAYWEAEMDESVSRFQADGSSMSRAVLARRSLKRLARRFPCPHWTRFAYHYFVKRGFLDGVEGYIFCHLLAEYEFWIWARRRELDKERKGVEFSHA
jgi:glycosyltransferase involved in cell wall biosynthesis